ncbi:MAG: glycosyltransferase, partial [Actinomycetota bacterium]|nr:glycosyltransferase [Actinomycetota bacterium]
MIDAAAGLSVLHVVVRASDTNSQYNEHCLPVMHERRITVCSLFPAAVQPPPQLVLIEGDGTVRGCYRALCEALRARTYDIVHVHSASSALLTLLVYARLRRSRQDLVLTLHNSWPNFRRRNRLFLWLVAALFPVVVACGDAAFASLPRALRRLTRRLEVVPNGVDVDRVDRVLHHHAFGLTGAPGQEGLTVLAVNRLIPIKNPDTVMEAFVRAATPQDELVMIGEGALGTQLAAAVQQSGLESQLRLTGGLPRDDVYRHMQGAAVFVSASSGEGLPVSVLEAMACRCPVVLSDIPPHREIAKHAPAVRLVTPGDVDAFADAIRRALRMPGFERYQVGEDLRRVAVRHFSVTAMNKGYGRVYRSVADHTNASAAQRLRSSARQPAQRARRRAVAWVAVALLGAIAGTWYGGSHPPQYRATT